LAGKTLIYNIKVKKKIEDMIEKVKTIVEIYTKIDKVNITIEDKKAVIETPPIISPIFKKKIADEIINLLDFKEVKFIETFKKPKEKE
jgi:hypothetical protein